MHHSGKLFMGSPLSALHKYTKRSTLIIQKHCLIIFLSKENFNTEKFTNLASWWIITCWIYLCNWHPDQELEGPALQKHSWVPAPDQPCLPSPHLKWNSPDKNTGMIKLELIIQSEEGKHFWALMEQSLRAHLLLCDLNNLFPPTPAPHCQQPSTI